MPSWDSGVPMSPFTFHSTLIPHTYKECGAGAWSVPPSIAFLTHTYFEEMHKSSRQPQPEYSEPPAIIGRLSYRLEPRNTPPVRLTIVFQGESYLSLVPVATCKLASLAVTIC